jgi:uncharacterized protein YjiS (DUF1127 family)
MTTATFHIDSSASARTISVRAWGQDLVRFAHYFLAALEVARQRRQLMTLDERTLKDIGITRADADHEAGRDFWDIPEEHMPRG